MSTYSIMLEMLYKPNIEKILKRYEAFWAVDILDRPPIRVRFTLDSMIDDEWSESVSTAEGHFAYWEHHAQLRAEFDDDEVPTATLDLGPAFMPAVMGGRINFSHGTSYSTQIISDLSEISALKEIRFDSSNPVIADYLARAEYFSKHASGKLAVGLAMLTGGGDILGALRGITEAYTDMCENPEGFLELLKICTDAWISVQKLQFQHIPSLSGGYCDNYGVWTPGKSSYFANDISTCVSSAMYRSLFMEQDCRIVGILECPWLHTHSAQFRLIPDFLEIPGLRGLQIVNDGISGPGFDEVFPFAKKVQKSGKCLLLRKYPMEELMPFLGELSPKGLLIDTQCGSLSEAKDILKNFSAQKFMKFY